MAGKAPREAAMYLVVTRWEPIAGHEREFEEAGRRVGSILRQQPGMSYLEGFRSGNQVVIVHGYRDEATYESLVKDPNGAFARAHAENRVEEFVRFVSSDGGETLAMT